MNVVERIDNWSLLDMTYEDVRGYEKMMQSKTNIKVSGNNGQEPK